MPDTKVPNIKGTEVLNLVKVLRMSRERALKLLPARLHHYLEQRILVSSWYPEEDQLGLLRAMVAMLPPDGDPWLTIGRSTAQTNLSGLYRNQVTHGDPERTLRIVGTFWRNAHDTGEMSSTLEEPGKVTVRLRGFARPSKEMCRIVRGYLWEIVSVSGGKDVSVSHGPCVLEGAPECAWQIAWA
jgi:hypothetical protein